MNWALDLFPAAIYICQSNEIEGIYSEEADLEYIAAWEHAVNIYIASSGGGLSRFSHEYICEIQGMLCAHQEDLKPEYKGAYRKVNVQVGGRICPKWEDVPELMEEWLVEWKSQTSSALDMHVAFERVHPFADGNGRTGRLLYWIDCLTRGETPILFTSADRFSYYRLFKNEEEEMLRYAALWGAWDGANRD